MNAENENNIQGLKDQIKKLEEQNRVLLEAMDFISIYVGGIQKLIHDGKTIEAFKKTEELSIYVLNAWKNALNIDHPDITMPK